MNTEIGKLLDFVCNFDKIDSKRSFYYYLDQHLKSFKGSSKSLIISISKDQMNSLSDFHKVRIVWSKDDILEKHGAQILEFINSFSSDCEQINKKKIDDKFYYGVFLEDEGKQHKFGIFVKEKDLGDDYEEHFGNFVHTAMRNINKFSEIKKLQSLVHSDDVTGLYNQRKLLKDLDESIERYKKYNENFHVLFLDIDHFKQVNDGHGHLVGTRLLMEMAEYLRFLLRESDMIYRYGGDEFVIIIQGISTEIATSIGERILKLVAEKKFGTQSGNTNGGFDLSVSIGVACFPTDATTRDEILGFADRMMYQAKESGRGKVCQAKDFFEKSDAKQG